MARKNLKPVSIAGIEFDALIEEQKSMSAAVPVYPVEDGFPVSDTIVLEPISIQMLLYVTNTPVSFLHRFGNDTNRANKVCEKLEELWFDRKLVKVVTPDAIYTDMGITNISIKKSKEIGYAREVSMQMQKVRTTKKKTSAIPRYVLKSGETMKNAGVASTSATSELKSGKNGAASKAAGNNKSKENEAKKSRSILYGIADKLF